MITLAHLLGSIAISSLISVLCAFFIVKNSREGISEEFQTTLIKVNEDIQTTLKPILDTNSRAMGIISAKSVDARQLKKAENLLSEGIIEQNQLLLQGIEAVSPQLSEYLTENPDVILGLLPRLQAILQKSGVNLGDLSGNPLSPSPATSSPHPFGSDER